MSASFNLTTKPCIPEESNLLKVLQSSHRRGARTEEETEPITVFIPGKTHDGCKETEHGEDI
jgi:hypothetical protein